MEKMEKFQVEILLDYLKNHPVAWNPRYNAPSERESEWRIISSRLNLDVNYVKAEWAHLCEKLRSLIIDHNEEEWEYFPNLKFLYEFIKGNPSIPPATQTCSIINPETVDLTSDNEGASSRTIKRSRVKKQKQRRVIAKDSPRNITKSISEPHQKHPDTCVQKRDVREKNSVIRRDKEVSFSLLPESNISAKSNSNTTSSQGTEPIPSGSSYQNLIIIDESSNESENPSSSKIQSQDFSECANISSAFSSSDLNKSHEPILLTKVAAKKPAQSPNTVTNKNKLNNQSSIPDTCVQKRDVREKNSVIRRDKEVSFSLLPESNISAKSNSNKTSSQGTEPIPSGSSYQNLIIIDESSNESENPSSSKIQNQDFSECTNISSAFSSSDLNKSHEPIFITKVAAKKPAQSPNTVTNKNKLNNQTSIPDTCVQKRDVREKNSVIRRDKEVSFSLLPESNISTKSNSNKTSSQGTEPIPSGSSYQNLIIIDESSNDSQEIIECVSISSASSCSDLNESNQANQILLTQVAAQLSSITRANTVINEQNINNQTPIQSDQNSSPLNIQDVTNDPYWIIDVDDTSSSSEIGKSLQPQNFSSGYSKKLTRKRRRYGKLPKASRKITDQEISHISSSSSHCSRCRCRCRSRVSPVIFGRGASNQFSPISPDEENIPINKNKLSNRTPIQTDQNSPQLIIPDTITNKPCEIDESMQPLDLSVSSKKLIQELQLYTPQSSSEIQIQDFSECTNISSAFSSSDLNKSHEPVLLTKVAAKKPAQSPNTVTNKNKLNNQTSVQSDQNSPQLDTTSSSEIHESMQPEDLPASSEKIIQEQAANDSGQLSLNTPTSSQPTLITHSAPKLRQSLRISAEKENARIRKLNDGILKKNVKKPLQKDQKTPNRTQKCIKNKKAVKRLEEVPNSLFEQHNVKSKLGKTLKTYSKKNAATHKETLADSNLDITKQPPITKNKERQENESKRIKKSQTVNIPSILLDNLKDASPTSNFITNSDLIPKSSRGSDMLPVSSLKNSCQEHMSNISQQKELGKDANVIDVTLNTSHNLTESVLTPEKPGPSDQEFFSQNIENVSKRRKASNEAAVAYNLAHSPHITDKSGNGEIRKRKLPVTNIAKINQTSLETDQNSEKRTVSLNDVSINEAKLILNLGDKSNMIPECQEANQDKMCNTNPDLPDSSSTPTLRLFLMDQSQKPGTPARALFLEKVENPFANKLASNTAPIASPAVTSSKLAQHSKESSLKGCKKKNEKGFILNAVNYGKLINLADALNIMQKSLPQPASDLPNVSQKNFTDSQDQSQKPFIQEIKNSSFERCTDKLEKSSSITDKSELNITQKSLPQPDHVQETPFKIVSANQPTDLQKILPNSSQKSQDRSLKPLLQEFENSVLERQIDKLKKKPVARLINKTKLKTSHSSHITDANADTTKITLPVKKVDNNDLTRLREEDIDDPTLILDRKDPANIIQKLQPESDSLKVLSNETDSNNSTETQQHTRVIGLSQKPGPSLNRFSKMPKNPIPTKRIASNKNSTVLAQSSLTPSKRAIVAISPKRSPVKNLSKKKQSEVHLNYEKLKYDALHIKCAVKLEIMPSYVVKKYIDTDESPILSETPDEAMKTEDTVDISDDTNICNDANSESDDSLDLSQDEFLNMLDKIREDGIKCNGTFSLYLHDEYDKVESCTKEVVSVYQETALPGKSADDFSEEDSISQIEHDYVNSRERDYIDGKDESLYETAGTSQSHENQKLASDGSYQDEISEQQFIFNDDGEMVPQYVQPNRVNDYKDSVAVMNNMGKFDAVDGIGYAVDYCTSLEKSGEAVTEMHKDELKTFFNDLFE